MTRSRIGASRQRHEIGLSAFVPHQYVPMEGQVMKASRLKKGPLEKQVLLESINILELPRSNMSAFALQFVARDSMTEDV